ncbi:uncharacterized protein PGTG_13029 [Puccinia graminis f. sp. tritici CRL 75-36-700-3]|uniref:Uncharacterized protein n=1 Tax=Puccinia graminis f. sp. tritici (strain CRL 75-36-700-3 / race SCCL) TaxID=418459 RepID=E3KQS2_PUCGT|nr:uncharacterized protein PGTG_13029 [Puccinia graminis f. sp. tritici CRL 75-36-700-3]EFP86647.1 hypothetical protein PGTG_13029 [Puccinia graminis f. sp. tritici CRL 75-36-700-3]
MTKNNKSAAGGPKTSAPTTLDTLFNTLQALVDRLDKIEALTKESSLNSEIPHHLMEFLTARLDDLAKRLERMEKTLDSDSIHSLDIQTNTPAPIHQQGKMSYASVATPSSKQTTAQITAPIRSIKNIPHPLPSIPSNSYINRFKRGHTIIRTHPGTEKPFLNLSPIQIVTNVNQALSSINAKIDNTLVQVQAVTRFPTGDIKIQIHY